MLGHNATTHLERGQNAIAGHRADCYTTRSNVHSLEIGRNTLITVEFGDNAIGEHNIFLHTKLRIWLS